MAGNIIGVIAQRLVRKLCTQCKAPYTPDAPTRRLLGMKDDDSRPVYQAVGCARCDNMGYKGRVAIMELFRLDAEIDELIARRATGREIRESFALAARAYPVEMVFYDNQRDEARAVANVEAAIARKVDLYIQYHRGAANTVVAEKLKAAGIPLLAMNYPIPGAPVYTADNVAAGRIAGEALDSRLFANAATKAGSSWTFPNHRFAPSVSTKGCGPLAFDSSISRSCSSGVGPQG